MMKMSRGAPSAIFKIDAYDQRFLRHRPSSAVPKKFAEGLKQSGADDALDYDNENHYH
jgi:hypothetical protein